MKITRLKKSCSAYALLMVMVITTTSALILGATLRRTYTVAKLNDRANDFMLCQSAAEAAVEKVFARMQYDFQAAGGVGVVTNNVQNGVYQAYVPTATEDPFWGKFRFSNASGTANRTYVGFQGLYTGELGMAYQGRYTANAPVYRIVSNAQLVDGTTDVIGTAQQEVLLALVPLTAYAIFYNGLLEFSTCATMVVNGPVHCNTNIYVGAGSGSSSSSTLTFSSTVTSSGSITAPANNGASWTGPNNYNAGNWNTYFNGTPSNYTIKVPTVQISIPMTNTHMLIEMPVTNDATTVIGSQRLYNQANVILLVSNTTVTAIIQRGNAGQVPGADPFPIVITTNHSSISNVFSFLSLTNRFHDRRENKTNITTQIDIGRYAAWLTNSPDVAAKFPDNTAFPAILYVADNRTVGANQMTSVRLVNGVAPPRNGGRGFSVATPNPLYVLGNYNSPNATSTTNTVAAGTVPCALMSDALTILSANWSDNLSLTSAYSDGNSAWNATSATTVNAAIITGIVPSTGNTSTTFSGGVHNLPRLLEDWSGCDFWLNTSIINLYSSTTAATQFQTPGIYYRPPTRRFSYDMKFADPAQTPPGIPCALIALRFNWAAPPPNTVTYNVSP